MRAPHVISVLAAGALAACAPTAPASPSWQTDVMPILAANCVRCHGYPSIGNAPTELRLDSFENTQVGVFRPERGAPLEARMVFGAKEYGRIASSRIDAPSSPMPPRFPLEPWQIETLKLWAPPDSPELPTRGEPRPGNQLPSLVVRELAQDPYWLTVTYSLHDPDGDLVAGRLTTDDGATFIAPIQTGAGELRIDISQLTLPLELTATIDDGAGFVDVPALTVGAP